MPKIGKAGVASWILVAAWVFVIFSFSSQSGEGSSKQSSRVIEAVAAVTYPSFHELEPSLKQEIINSLQLPVRKLAHLLEYALLGCLLYFALESVNRRGITKHKVLLALVCCFVLAVLDEWCQSLSPGRAPGAVDVMIDFAGAFAGICFGIISKKIFCAIRSLK